MNRFSIYKFKFLLAAMLLFGGTASAQVVVNGNVYGGGLQGKVLNPSESVKGNTQVIINGGTIEGSVYGGGMGLVDDETSGAVSGNTLVDMKGGTVERSIYGGGELGSVGTFTQRYATATGAHVMGEPKVCAENTGLTKVLLSGGTVGVSGSLMPIASHDPDDDDRGWIFCGGCGERDSIANPKANLLAVVDTTYLEISGGVVTASVYGGCENGLVLGGTYVKIKGGQIGTGYKGIINGEHTWDDEYDEQDWTDAIDAIRDGSFDDSYTAANNPFHECHAWPYGDGSTPQNFYVYDIYTEHETGNTDLAGGALYGSDGHSFFGNVFGGGSGYYPIYDEEHNRVCWRRSAGRVWGDTRVDIEGGHILTSVYGGNELTDVMGKALVNMSGGTLGVPRTLTQIQAHPTTCYLFGAGMGDERTYFNTWTNVAQAEVNITGGTIFGSVYGGGEEGHVLGDIEVNIGQAEGKTTTIGTLGYTYYEGNIYGGGRGFSGRALTAGSVGGNIDLNITGGLMLGSVYGGGRLASVGTYFVPVDNPNYGHLQPGTGHGYITVNITGGTIGNHYEEIEHPTEHSYGGNVFGGSKGRVELLDGTTENPRWPRLACAKHTQVNITGSNVVTIKGNVYGGPELGHVHEYAGVKLDNENVAVHKVFGGGHGSNDITHHTNDSTSTLHDQAVPAFLAGRVMGNTKVEILKGTVLTSVYGGGEMATVGMVKSDGTLVAGTAEVIISGTTTTTKVGNADMYDEYVPGNSETITDHAGHVFGGGQGIENDTHEDYKLYCNVNHTDVTVNGGKIYGSVFGGGADSHVLGDVEMAIHAGANIGSIGTTSWDGNVFGGGKGNCAVNSTAGRVAGNVSILMDGGTIYSSIFGGGRHGVTGVDENGDFIDEDHGNVEIEVSGTSSTSEGVTTYSTVIGIDNGYDLLESDESVGDIFGSGKGDTDNYDDVLAGRVTNAEITVTGNPRIFGSVFGGGEMASLGYWDASGAFYENTGSATVTIGTHGGTDNPVIGTEYEFTMPSSGTGHVGQWTIYEEINNVSKLAHTATGNVFGGCQGDVDPDSPHWVSMGRSHDATVNIHGGTIMSCVFGGAEQGTVAGNTQVNVCRGTIGHQGLTASDGTTTYNFGSVFGGGYGGTDLSQPHANDSVSGNTGIAFEWSGRTYGNTEVNMSGGQVYENVFGGGDIASVGFVKNGALKNGHCKVTVSGSAVVGPLDGTLLNGYVYGGGQGVGNDLDNPSTPAYDEFYKDYCNVNSTEVIVSLGPTGRVYGSLFGGGADGHVLDTTSVTLNSGLIGTDGITSADGNIFGGGRNFLKRNYTAGRVGGNIHVVMNGGTLQGSIFGGGRLALTGIDKDGAMQSGDDHGNVKVEVKGGTVGNASRVVDFTQYSMGDVYGGGKGDMNGIAGHPAASALLLSLTKNTEVIISGTAKILGSVYGGGEVANVGKYQWTTGETAPYVSNIQLLSDGKTKITVNGGSIGANLMKMRPDIAAGDGNYDLKYNDDVGHVFGGGEGRNINPNDNTLSPVVDTEGNRLVDLLATVRTTEVNIGGTAWVKGSVYGGAAMGHVRGDTKVTVEGGQIGAGYYPALAKDSLYAPEKFFNPVTYFSSHPTYSDIANGDTLKECVSWDYDPATNRFFDPVALKEDASNNYQNSKPTNGHSWFGSVYGGGSGYYPYITTSTTTGADTAVWNPESGRVWGNSTVEIKGGHILSNVYGGGEVGDLGTLAQGGGYTANTGKAVVKMSGGTVGVPRKNAQIRRRPFNSNLFGAGKGDARSSFNPLCNVVVDSVVISNNAIVYGSVFGGAEVGHVIDSTNVLVKNDGGSQLKTPVIGTTGFSGYDGHVFGGGWGNRNVVAANSNWAAGRVGGNAHVKMTNGAVLGNLYGGGFVARVGVGVNGDFEAFVTTTTVEEVTTSVYQSQAHGLAKVDISGGFVGNDANNGRLLLMSDEKAGNVFGSGRGDPTEHIEDDFGRVANSVANVSGSPTIYGNVFGGGQMANAGHWDGYANWYTVGTSKTHVNIKGSPIIGTALEFNYNDYLSKTGVNAPRYTEFDTIKGMKMIAHTRTGNVYGGGQGDVKQKTEGTWSGHPEGFEQGHCGSAEVRIEGSPEIRSSVFGGSDQGVVWGDTKVTIAGGTIGTQNIFYDSLTYNAQGEVTSFHHKWKYSHGNVYGGSYGADAYSRYFNLQGLTGEHLTNVVDSINRLTGCVYGNAEVNITGGTIRGNVFGGGDKANVGTKIGESNLHASNGICTVNVSGGEIGPLDNTGLNAYVFGGGNGFASDPDELRKAFANVDSTFVTVSGGTIHGSVFGGGNDSHTLGSTSVTVHTGAEIGEDGLSTWDGNIFGGGRNFVNSNHSNGRVAGNIDITMDGGTIQGSIFGGGRLALSGVNEDGEFQTINWDPTKHGNVTINVSGGVIGNEDGYDLLTGSDESVGDIFGSGKGDTKDYQDILAGRVTNSTINISGDTRIYGAVFGGGEMASLGWWTNSGFIAGTGASTITIDDNPTIGTYLELDYGELEPSEWTIYDTDHKLIHTCTGNVFGGCQGDVEYEDPAWENNWPYMGRSLTSTININGGTIMGDVFGGPEQGTMDGNTYVNINGGTIGTNMGTEAAPVYFGGVYGAGYGSDDPEEDDVTLTVNGVSTTTKMIAGRVYGNTLVNVMGGTVADVYGGGNFAYVGDDSSVLNGNTRVNIGAPSRTDNPVGDAIIDGMVFGANNHSGTPYGNAVVHVYKTHHTTADEYPDGDPCVEPESPDDLGSLPDGLENFAIPAVYGGSNLADYTPVAGRNDTVHVHYCKENTIYEVYGGCNAAAIGPSTTNTSVNSFVIIDGGRINQVFGGGNGTVRAADVHGTATTTINGGLIHELFGGSNNNGQIDEINLVVNEEGNCPVLVGDGFGGNNSADVIADVTTTLNCGEGAYANFYGGSRLGDIYGDLTVNVMGGTYTNFFAGSKGQADNPNTLENEARSADIREITAAFAEANHLPASSVGHGGNITLNIYGGTIENAFGGSDVWSQIDGKITVNVIDTVDNCGLRLTNVYGAGRYTTYKPLLKNNQVITSPEVNVIHADVLGNVYGGALGDTATVYANPVVNIGYDAGNATMAAINYGDFDPTTGVAHVHGDVYGGGEMANVNGTTHVNLVSGEVGVMRNPGHNPELDIDTYTLDGGRVYGGGQGDDRSKDLGCVTGNTFVNVSGTAKIHNCVYGGGMLGSVGSGNLNDKTSGVATVTISGGEVGPLDGTGMNAYVYGGGRGKDSDLENAFKAFANVDSSSVIVCDSARIWGSIFGGSADGHVIGDARILVEKGTNTKNKKPLIGTNGKTSWDGNIFGGGRNYNHTNYTAGRVGGNIVVEMTDGQIYGNIYGGGRLGLTGVDVDGNMQDGNAHGNTKVIVKGGTIGNNTKTGSNPNDPMVIEVFSTHSMGNVYGGGMGTFEKLPDPHPAASSLLLGLTKNTEVIIKDSINGSNLVSRPHVYGMVLGGGELANVGKYTWDQDGYNVSNIQIADGTGLAKVNISGGIIGADKTRMRSQTLSSGSPWLYYNDDLGYVYGGGEGLAEDPDDYPEIHADGPSEPTTSLLDLMATVNNTEVTISDGWVKASVFGGGESGHVRGDTKVTISGGQIGAGYYVINGAVKDSLYVDSQFVRPDTIAITSAYALHGTASWDFGKTYNVGTDNEVTLYKPFDPVLLSQDTIPSDGKSWFGNVFGGGSGWFPYVTGNAPSNYESHWNPISGKVWGNTEVNITGGHILNNVYGANESTDVGGKATVKMSGGTVGVPLTNEQITARPLIGYIYGGGAGDPRPVFNGITNVENTDVQITGGVVYSSVYGGAEDGHILSDTKVTIGQDTGKTTVIGSSGKSGYDGNVFGGGRNYFGENKDAGHVSGETTIDMSNGLAMGSVYGGGRSGSVTKSTHVNLSGGQVGTEQIGADQMTITNGNVYGGGLGLAGGRLSGNAHEFANVDSTYINLSDNAYIVGSVFGGGDNGHVLKSTVINMTGGTVGQKNVLKEFVTDSLEHATYGHIYTGSVLGGGRGTATDNLGQYNDTTGIVFGNTNVSISGGTVRHAVYGGGGLSHVGTFTRNATTNEITFTNGGKCTVSVTGGLIGPKKEDLTQPTAADLTPAMTGYEDNITTQQYIDTVYKYLGGNVGWVFGAGCGLTGEGNDRLTFNDSTFVTIGGIAQVTGSVFGGGENGHVKNNTRVVVSGGTIGGMPLHAGSYTVPAGAGEYAGVSVTLAAKDSETREDVYGAGRYVFRGNVYGGGKGTDLIESGSDQGKYSMTAGRVYGNTKVVVSGGTIYNRVYGGGSLASVGTFTYHDGTVSSSLPLTDQLQRISYDSNTGITNVTVSGGTIGSNGRNNGDVVGGGRGIAGNPGNNPHAEFGNTDPADQVVRLAYAGSTNVNIHNGANIKSNVYGGSINGHVYGDTQVTIDGGTIGSADNTGWHSNVFGGGGGSSRFKKSNGSLHFSLTSGRVYGNTNVTIESSGTSESTYKPTIYGNVYGGGAIASVGSYDLRTGHESIPVAPNTGITHVTVTSGTIGTDGDYNGDVYGGGRGWPDAPLTYLDTLTYVVESHVSIGKDNDGTFVGDAQVKGSVYGSGENGHLYKQANVKMYSGTVEQSVFGAGEGAEHYMLNGKQRYNPMAGVVQGNTDVKVYGGLIKENVYGGGRLASVGILMQKINNEPVVAFIPDSGEDTFGYTNVEVTGGTIGDASVVQYLDADHPVRHGNVFGASMGMLLDTTVNRKWEYLANVKATHVRIGDDDESNSSTATVLSSVYGGSEVGIVRDSTYVQIQKGAVIGEALETLALHRGNVFAGGCGNDTITYLADEHHAQDITMYVRKAGVVMRNARLEMTGGTVYGNLYGGCEVTDVGTYNYPQHGSAVCTAGGKATVIMRGGEVGWERSQSQINARPYYGYVYGSGKGNPAVGFNTWTNVNNANVEISGGTVYGSVLGGGEEGHVMNNTHVVVKGGTIGRFGYTHFDGNVFGAGRGRNPVALTAGSIGGNALVEIQDGTIRGSVFGGGNNGSVGIYLVPTDHEKYGEMQTGTNHGYTKVNVSGGTIGHEVTPELLEEDPRTGGNVYGGGRGLAGAPGSTYQNLAKVKQTEVNISESDSTQTFIMGSVFGSGEDGHVLQDTYVNVYDGQIGGKSYDANPAACSDGYHGNVYGGGRGLDTYTADGQEHYSMTAGKVSGNSNVLIKGGRVVRNVYGGGNIASVGEYIYEYDETTHEIIDTIGLKPYTGMATVRILGGKIGIASNVDHDHGNVFGSSHGVAGHEYKNLAYVHNTLVEVDSVAVVCGAVFGGGDDGHVNQNTMVNVSGGTIGFQGNDIYHGNVYGGGRGLDLDASGHYSPTAGEVYGKARVNIKENETYGYTPTIWHNVYGGGSASVVHVSKVVNVSAGEVKGSVFGGSRHLPTERENKSPRFVNMWGGTVDGDVYGCSYQGNDGDEDHDKLWASFINMSGGTVKGNVYGAGYQGNVKGSVGVLIGKYAIEHAPVLMKTADSLSSVPSSLTKLDIQGSVYGGSNFLGSQSAQPWRTFDITGYSNVIIDGTGYNMDADTTGKVHMHIAGGLYGSGTNCESGAEGRDIIIRNYGDRVMYIPGGDGKDIARDSLNSVTRTLTTIQRVGNLFLDHANIALTGAHDISDPDGQPNIYYGVYQVDTSMVVSNGSSIVLGDDTDLAHIVPAYIDSVKVLRSVRLDESIYEKFFLPKLNYTWIGVHDGRVDEGHDVKLYYNNNPSHELDRATEENVIIFKGTSQLFVRYHIGDENQYGELQGFFRMSSPFKPRGTESFAYARQKVTATPDTKADGGFASYYSNYNFFTDDGADYTRVKQYPYTNIIADPVLGESRGWFIPDFGGNKWYVDGRQKGVEAGGWGDNSVLASDGGGRYPDKPKLTIVGSQDTEHHVYSIMGDPSLGSGYGFNSETDIIYVVGAVSGVKELVGNTSGRLGPNASHSTLPLRIYRYPGGHKMSNESYDYGPEGTAGTTKGPGPWYGTLLSLNNEGEEIMAGKTLVLDSVLIDGLYGVTDPGEVSEHEINNVNIPSTSYYHGDNSYAPLATVNKGALRMKGGTELKRGYNNYDASGNLGTVAEPNYNFYVNPDFDNSVVNGGGVYVAPDASAKLQVEGVVTLTGNKQKKGSGTIESNVYLPTFNKSIEITDALDVSSIIGVTSPNRNAEKYYWDNTFSPVAVGVRTGNQAKDAKRAWTNNNFRDDQGWFFSNDAAKDTYYLEKHSGKDDPHGTINEETVYFGWTWANVVRTAPAGYSVEGNNITVSSEEGLAWLISQTTAINGADLTTFSGNTISLTSDLNLRQYVWVPIGSEINTFNNRIFSGIFDGQGHLIDSLFIEYTSFNDHRYRRTNYGLFGDVDGGTIKRTFVVGGMIQPGSSPEVTSRDDYNIGGLVGLLEGETAFVSESEAALKVYLDREENVVVGGLVGQMLDGEIHSSMAMPEIVMGTPVTGLAGGLVGKVEGGQVNNSFVNGKFSILNTDNQKLGGLLGGNANATVENCYVNMRDDDELPQNNGYFDGIVKQVGIGSNIDYVYVKPGVTFTASQVGAGCEHYTEVMDADKLGYMYVDNRIEDDTAMFYNMNRWVDSKNGSGHKYAKWARPGLSEINGDLPVLLLSEFDGTKAHQGGFRSLSTYEGGPVLQYGGPVRDTISYTSPQLDGALTRATAGNSLFIYGDVVVEPTVAVSAHKVSVYEHASILAPGSLVTAAGGSKVEYDETYVGITFDNSKKSATATFGMNYGLNGGTSYLSRDWHMFSTPLSSAPLGFDYKGDNVANGPKNNPWANQSMEFNWLNNGTGGNIRYWMKGWSNSQGPNTPETYGCFDADNWVDGYFPSNIPDSLEFGFTCVEGTDEDDRYPYGMDFYTWTEPDYHWINFKRNGPNHWHSDGDHLHIDYEPVYNAPQNVNEDNLIVGRGYMAAIATQTFLQSHGTLNKGPKGIRLTSEGAHCKGWNLVGNPYHAYIDFDELAQNNSKLLAKEGTHPFCVVYNADGYAEAPSDAFVYYVQSGSEGGAYAGRYLHPHQGFYVKMADDASDEDHVLDFMDGTEPGSVVVSRETAGVAPFRDEQPKYPLVNLFLSSDNGCNDVTVVELERPEWGGAVKLRELRNGNGVFYAQHDNMHFAALFAKEGTERVPLWFEAKEDDIYTIKWNTANGDFHSMYLIDNILGVQYDMLRNDTYRFEGHVGDYPSRFYIVFNVTDVDEHLEGDGFVFFDGSQWLVTGDGQLEFIDLNGQVLLRTQVSGQTRVTVPNVASALYLFRLTNGKETKVQKVFVNDYERRVRR